MVVDIASGTLQPLLKIVNGHLRSWDQHQDPGIFMKLKMEDLSKFQLVSLQNPQKILGFFLQNKHNFGCLS